VRLSQLGTSATILHILPARMVDDDECGAVGGMTGRRNQNTRRKRAPVPLCPPQTPHDPTWARTRATTMGNRRLAARAMVRPSF
jgi:hypothetical protein